MPDADRLGALLTAYELKDEKRTGWVRRDVTDPESVAAHSWGVTLLCEIYGSEAGIDVSHAIRLAVAHDLAEAKTGDVPHPEATPAVKEEREREAIHELDAGLDADVRDRWEEYEAQRTREAKFVKDMDLLDMCVQALAYERADRATESLDEFFETTEPQLSTEIGRAAFEEVRARHDAEKDAYAAEEDV